jgi:hypothetical protein
MFKSCVITVFSLVSISAVSAQSLPQMRTTPAEIANSANTLDGNQIGSSGLFGPTWVQLLTNTV